MDVLGQEHRPDEWRLFIVSSKLSLETTLPHNGNKYPSVPATHPFHTNMHHHEEHALYDKYSRLESDRASAYFRTGLNEILLLPL
jgi:hypothetical protein